jgi:hypothetical protein
VDELFSINTTNGANDEQAPETSEAIDEQKVDNTVNTEDEDDFPSSLPSAALSPPPSASPSFVNEDIGLPRVRPLHRSQRSNSAPASSRLTSSSVAFDYATDLRVSLSHPYSRIISTAAVIHNKTQLLPDVLYTGRTPPFWRWSDSDLPAVRGVSDEGLASPEHSGVRAGVRDDSGMWETVTFGTGPSQHDNGFLRSMGSGYPTSYGATAANEAEGGQHAANGEVMGMQQPQPKKKAILRRISKAFVRKSKGSKL